MTYNLEFLPKAIKEWEALDRSVKEQFKQKLAEARKSTQSKRQTKRLLQYLQNQTPHG